MGFLCGRSAAVLAGRALALRKSMLARAVVIPRLHAQLKRRIL